MGRRTSRTGRSGLPGHRSRPGHLRVNESLPAVGGRRPTLHRRNYLTSDRTSKGRLRRHYVMASPPLTCPIVSTGIAGMEKGERGAARTFIPATTAPAAAAAPRLSLLSATSTDAGRTDGLDRQSRESIGHRRAV
jgi:hypothetical protein